MLQMCFGRIDGAVPMKRIEFDDGALNVTRTVCASMTCAPARLPMIAMKLGKRLARIRLKLNSTSSAVTGLPSCHFALGLSLKSTVRPLSLISHESARFGTRPFSVSQASSVS
ncbi:MAG: hypothetical protein BWY85_01298 [Firmicutes bacterium ADurb.Bin506]|nr:MAG: hypothetical protein BWY85_01298 [Firmicutes bacterium ADurb.Bin506]